MSRFTSLLFSFSAVALGGELIFPAAVERDAPVSAVYRLNPRATGKGELSIRWTDVYGPGGDERKNPVELNHQTEIGFSIVAGRAVSIENPPPPPLTFTPSN